MKPKVGIFWKATVKHVVGMVLLQGKNIVMMETWLILTDVVKFAHTVAKSNVKVVLKAFVWDARRVGHCNKECVFQAAEMDLKQATKPAMMVMNKVLTDAQTAESTMNSNASKIGSKAVSANLNLKLSFLWLK